jgi:hypothetical protein
MDIARLKEGRRAPKQPWRPSWFTRVHTLVTVYKLTPDFVRTLAGPETGPAPAGPGGAPQRPKASLNLPLFALATPGEYELTMAILAKIDNPYLDYVQDPEELRLCGPLFRRNPHLSPEELVRVHFAALLARETASRVGP